MFRLSHLRSVLVSILMATMCCSAHALPGAGMIDTKDVFALLNLDRPGLEKVRQSCQRADYAQASRELLNYYRLRKGVVNPYLDPANLSVSKREQKWADDALQHTFYVHDGYQPSFNYGRDINWKYWPVKDNELRWQLHRHKWFTPMGKVYRKTGDERYAQEWMLQYTDWITKNPTAEVAKNRKALNGPMSNDIIENAAFAWRPLETSHRLQDQINQFTLFISSPNFTPEFLLVFLRNYHRHADHIMRNFSAKGNHLLFEAQRIFYAGTFFPEFIDAPTWQKRGIDILNREIATQVYDDGGQFELDPHYHLACINIFCKAIEIAKANHVERLIPQSYIRTVEKMIDFYANICYPDYTNPCFSDAKLGDPKAELRNFKNWSRLFPHNPTIRYFATRGKQGTPPAHLSRGFLSSGFFTFRNGWGMDATVMVVKAGPKAEWHCQPDNGTFELWFDGKKLFPDSGSYIYGGDKEVQKMRNWFRQTTVHNTLTLDHQNIETTASQTLLWQPEGKVQTLVTENQSYARLRHRRTVFFVDGRFFVIVDEAIGAATGRINLNYHLADGRILTDTTRLKVTTQYADGRNVMICGFSDRKARLAIGQGWYSKAYRQKTARPWLSFDVDKFDDAPVGFVTVVTPFRGNNNTDTYQAKILKSTDHMLQVEVIRGGSKQLLEWHIKQPYWLAHAIDVASQQLLSTAKCVVATDSFPRSLWKDYDVAFIERQLQATTDSFRATLVKRPAADRANKLRLCDLYDWTSGFFPGSLWYAYKLTGKIDLKQQAVAYTQKLNALRHYKNTHDLGFMVGCSYGNAHRLSPNDTIQLVIAETADNLAGRFDERIGCIRSWDFGSWNFPVIIDNMMNLKLLFEASEITGRSKYRDIAIRHALTTMKHHFRPDFTSYHVVSYNSDGSVERKCTFQGKADDSSWARGQAWALYGYTDCFLATGNPVFLRQAVNIANMIMSRVQTADNIPYWDYDAPQAEETPRDASAAAITASAMFALSKVAPKGNPYFAYGESILKSLSSPAYLAKVGANEGFVLMHSVGSLPNGSEVDTPINYADYYYLEALDRYINVSK